MNESEVWEVRSMQLLQSATLVGVTWWAAVLLLIQHVSVRQQPACRAVHVAVAGAAAVQVPEDHVFAGALCHGDANHWWKHWRWRRRQIYWNEINNSQCHLLLRGLTIGIYGRESFNLHTILSCKSSKQHTHFTLEHLDICRLTVYK